MSANYFIGTDIGTSATKTVLVNLKGEIVASATETYSVLTPHPLWAEQWPDVWFDAVVKTIKSTIEKSKVDAGEIGGLTISGLYGGSGIPCDEDMKPVRPCLIWMDKRAQAESDWVRDNIGAQKIFEVSENNIDPYYGYTKMLWIKNNEPEAWKRIKYFVTPYAYCAYQLTGKFYYDHCSAGNIGAIYDMKAKDWSDEMLKAFDIPRSMFGDEIVDSTKIIGTVHEEGAALTGLKVGTPVGAGGVDCVVALLSAGGINCGEHVAMIGTSMAWGMIHEGASCNKTINMPFLFDVQNKTYSYAGATTSGGIVTWFTDEFVDAKKLGCDETHGNLYRALDGLAEKVAPGSDGLLMLPYFMGERAPVWNPFVRGTLYGMTLYHNKGHIFRSILEAVAYSLRTGIECADEIGAKLDSNLIIVGGVTKSNIWKQIFADVTNCNILCPNGGGEAAYGDALLIANATGAVKGVDTIKEWVSFEPEIKPNAETVAIYNKYYDMYMRLYEAIRPLTEELARLDKQ